jgi:hydroxyacylglutathione hydrolase
MSLMIFLRIKSEGLAHLSYFIGSGGEAVVIDPRRDTDAYIEIARRNCIRIKCVLETHRNEDYVIGSLELKAQTGCAVYHGRNLPFKYGEGIAEGDVVDVGGVRIKALETPGHTPESMTYVLYDNGGAEPLMAFPGDALFPGTTGRTDLWGTEGEAAGMLYDSLMKKILPLGDKAILCPAHGSGSVCGTGFSDRDDSTLGYERLTNPDLRLDKKEFISKKIAEPLERPNYFKQMESYNLDGPPVTGGPPQCAPMSTNDFGAAIGRGILIDARMPSAFSAHIPGSYSIWLDGMATWPGWIADHGKPIYLLLEKDNDVDTAVKYLYRLGFNNVKGYLCGGFQPWVNAGRDTEFTGLLVPDALAGMLSADKVTVLDVRSGAEWVGGHVKGAKHIYVGELERRTDEVPKGKPIACMCSTGLRASLAASMLKRAGSDEVYNVLGGITAWKAKDYPLVHERMLEK